MVLLESKKIAMGSPALDFSLPGVDGQIHTLRDFENAKILVVVFMCNHCPYVQAIWGRLVSLQRRFEDKSVQFVGINPNVANSEYEEETLENMKRYAEDYHMNFSYLADEDQSVAKEYGAQCTPDIYVYDSGRNLVYHGRLDDNWQNPDSVEKEELADAINNVIEGGEPFEVQNPSMGCSIKWV
jgi:peroxiredoxin